MKIFLALLLSIVAWGVTASPTAITVYMRAYGAYPYYASAPPPATAITISGTGSWNMARGGTLSTACGLAFGYCFNAVTTITSICSGALPTGSGAGSTNLCWAGLVTNELAVGTHTGTLTIGDTVIAVTLVVLPPNAFVSWGYASGFPNGCSTPAGYDTAATCVITNERPASNSFAVPSVGGTYVDPQFGGTVRRVTAKTQNIQYGALSSFNSDATLIMTTTSPGNVNVYTVATGTETYSNLSGVNLNFAAWDPVNPDKIWYMDGAAIKSRVLSTSTVTTLVTMPWAITMGGTVDITDDGWWAFRDNTSFNNACAINLNTGITYCADLSSYGITDLDFTQVTQVDSGSRKRYVVLVAAPSTLVFSVDLVGGDLNFENTLAVGEPHSDVGQDSQGRQIFFWNWSEIYGNQTYIGAVQLAKGADSLLPVEVGGGLVIAALDSPGNFTTDGHFGCTWRGVCSYAPYGNSAGIGIKQIQTLTAANPCQINSTGHGYISTNSVLIGGAAGTGTGPLNAIHTVTVLNANAYTIPIDCSVGYTYTANSANSILNVATAPDAPFRQEIMITQVGQQVNRVAVHRAKTYDNGSDVTTYANTPRCSIARDASAVSCASNMGVPETQSVYVAYTGTSTAQRLSTFVDPTDTGVIFNYIFPTSGQGAATIVVSTLPSLATPVVNVSDGLASQTRQYIASGLTAATQYYFRISSLGWSYTGQFRTLPTLSGTGQLQLIKGGGGTINYGATSGLGSSCSSPCALNGIAKGLLYSDVSGTAKATVVQ